jgi:molybdate transport system regulatory protein
MNRCFREPLIETHPGGGAGAGARLTVAGEKALAAYRSLSAQVERGTSGPDHQALEQAIREQPLPSHV